MPLPKNKTKPTRFPKKGHSFLIRKVTPAMMGQIKVDKIDVHQVPLDDIMEIEMLMRLTHSKDKVRRNDKDLLKAKVNERLKLSSLINKSRPKHMIFSTVVKPGTYKKYQIVDELPHIKEEPNLF